MDIDLLPTLVALADTGSLTAAARRVALTQPAVHQQLARLADQVGRPVYRREGRRLVLTEAGLALAAFGRRVAVDRDRVLAGLRGEAAERPVVCAGRGTWLFWLRVGLDVRPSVADGPGAVAAVREGRAHLGIAAVDVPEDLVGRAAFEVGQRVVRPERWEGPPRWVLPPRGRPLREQVEALLGPCAVDVEAEGWDLLLRFVALGAGWTVVNDGVPLPDGVVDAAGLRAPPVVYRAFWHPSVAGEAVLARCHLSVTGPRQDRAASHP